MWLKLDLAKYFPIPAFRERIRAASTYSAHSPTCTIITNVETLSRMPPRTPPPNSTSLYTARFRTMRGKSQSSKGKSNCWLSNSKGSNEEPASSKFWPTPKSRASTSNLSQKKRGLTCKVFLHPSTPLRTLSWPSWLKTEYRTRRENNNNSWITWGNNSMMTSWQNFKVLAK